ncbi:MAG: isoleucine--tRNA ligase [Trueperaceae bacterium]|nr:isoleucine--tRNA ligase [Trueperaceae bacterium]
MYREVSPKVDFPELERRVIERWRERDVFRRSVDREPSNGEWVFYEGPPTANGLPGLHHVIARAFKDLFPRFKTMQGYRVRRKGGWDTHGLPVEIAVEKRLGFTNKQQIEEYGIEAFNRLCREDVFRNIQEWNAMTERIGFWLDLENAYVTYHDSYIESCWWIMKSLFERGLLVEDYKTTWHSPSSNTTLASHEVSLGYQEDVEDPSVFPKFPADPASLAGHGVSLADPERTVYLLAWTTTPWTLGANTGLAVSAEADYALVEAPARHGDTSQLDLYILAADLVDNVFGEGNARELLRVPGTQLSGLRYRQIMHGRPDGDANEATTTGYRVVADEIVSLGDGTGIVHVAPAYGDLEVGRRHGLPTVYSVDLTGKVMPEVRLADGTEAESGRYTGTWFKDADAAITADLTAANLLYRSGTIRHTYPFNWRDGKPLMNVAKKSWYVKTTAVRDLLLANNDAIGWHPDGVRTGRFGKWLENNVDWALSRERYWGATMPIWRSEDGDTICVGSVKELSELAGRDLTGLDLHRPYVDDIVITKNGKEYRRLPYTVDVWFESGAMPYAQWHYLGEESSAESKTAFDRSFPADYICEAIDQTRGWFYSLHALGTLMTDPGDPATGRPAGPLAHLSPPTSAFKNVIVLGHIVDEKGEKMSKSKGNVIDPWAVLNVQGADPLRWNLYSSTAPEATRRFSIDQVEETLRDYFLTLWNVYSFYVLYANLERPDLQAAPAVGERPLIDRWLVSRVESLTAEVTAALEDFDPTTASRALRDFVVDDLSNWYVRLNRRRFWRSGSAGVGSEGAGDSLGAEDSTSAFATLHHALVTVAKLMAPMAPFMSDEIYCNLVAEQDQAAPDSVHLAAWPVADAAAIDAELMLAMRALMRVTELGRAARAASGVKLRQPLSEVLVRLPSEAELEGVRSLQDRLKDELNVKSVRFLAVQDEFVDYLVKPNLPRLGKRFGNRLPKLREALAAVPGRVVAANARAGVPTLIEIDGESIELEAEDVLLEARSPEGYAAEEAGGYLAALNTAVTPELKREGLARDVVRLVQNARKTAGLDVSDRISLRLSASGELAAALDEHAAAVAGEVLAASIEIADLAVALSQSEHAETHDIEGETLTLALAKAPTH